MLPSSVEEDPIGKVSWIRLISTVSVVLAIALRLLYDIKAIPQIILQDTTKDITRYNTYLVDD